jgi:hypothetical protein
METADVGTTLADAGYHEVLTVYGLAGTASGYNPFDTAYLHSTQAIARAHLA